jgi:hypothetical protein
MGLGKGACTSPFCKAYVLELCFSTWLLKPGFWCGAAVEAAETSASQQHSLLHAFPRSNNALALKQSTF